MHILNVHRIHICVLLVISGLQRFFYKIGVVRTTKKVRAGTIVLHPYLS